MKRKLLIVGVAAIVFPFLASATPPQMPTDIQWEYRSRITGGTSIQSEYVVLDIPSEFFSYLKSDLSDLRIWQGGEFVPYVLGVERETNTFDVLPGRMINLSSIPGESTSFIVDLGASGSFHNAVAIDTSSTNFRRIVEIQGSDDRTSWRTLNPRGQIFDYTVKDIKSVSVEDTLVTYPESTYRYLLVKILDQGEGSLAVYGARVRRERATPSREISYTPAMEVRDNKEERASDVVLDFRENGIPTRRAILSSSSRNFHRPVGVYDSEDGASWRLLTHGYIFRIDTPAFRGENLEITYPETNRRYIRLSILNGDDLAIGVENVRIFGVVRKIIFRNLGGEEAWVLLGNPTTVRAVYDIERISQYLNPAELDRVSVGPIERNQNFMPPPEKKVPITERSPYILPVVLGFVVAILSFLLFRVAERMRTTSPPNSPV